MNLQTKFSLRCGMFTCLFGVVLFTQAGERWTNTLGLQATQGAYTDAQIRDRMANMGVMLSSDYLDNGGFTLGSTRTEITNRNGFQGTRQDAAFVSGRYHFTPDQIPGRLTTRLDLHYINNNDVTRNTDKVKTYAPQISYLSADKRRYLDLGYARSLYQEDLHVEQWTPTVGLGFNEGADWLQFRGWFIASSNQARSQGKSSTQALEMKWTHWLGQNPLRIDNIKFGLVEGERIYAVDGDAGSVANLADVNRGAASVGAEWKVGDTATVQAIVGQDRFTSTDTATNSSNDYRLGYGYLWLSNRW